MDILIVADNNLETVGGEQESSKIIINSIKSEYKVGVIQPGEIKKPCENVEYYSLTSQTRIKHLIKNPFSFIRYILNVKKQINLSQPKVIHTQAQVSFFMIALLKKLRFISRNIKIVHTERGLYTKYNDIFKRMFFFFFKELDILVTTTEFNMKYWKEALKKKKLDLDYKVIENTAGEFFEKYNKNYVSDNKKLVIGFAGRQCDWKNWPLAVEISKKLDESLNQDVYVKMAIGCLDDKSIQETQRMFKDLNNYLGGRFKGSINISLEEMDEFYYDIDVFVLTSNFNSESFGRTLVEAMSRRTVVLSTNSGGSVEVVGDKNNIYNTSDEFCEKIIKFYNDKDLMNNEKHKNMNRVRENYSLENNINKHLSMYKKIIS